MSVVDLFLSALKMNDESGFGDEDYLDDEYDGYDDFEEERPKKRIIKRSYDDELDDEPVAKPSSSRAESDGHSSDRSEKTSSFNVSKTRSKTSGIRSTKVSPMRSRKGNGMEVCVIRPKSMEDAREITETLLEDCTVVLNMEGLDLEVAQRIIDFSSGSCYAMHGNLQKISNYIFIITPESVDISGDFQEMLSGAVDIPAFGTRF